jgi:hypothetical protein
MPWAPEDKKVLLEELQWFKGIPYVPGGSYLAGRELYNSWKGTVIDKGNYREQLENSIENIRKEMTRMEQEFGLIDDNGNAKKELDFVQVPIPRAEGSK